MGRKEEIHEMVAQYTKNLRGEDFIESLSLGLAANEIASKLGMTRNNVSKELNCLAREGRLLRCGGKPVLYIDALSLQNYLENEFETTEEYLAAIRRKVQSKKKRGEKGLSYSFSKLDLLIGTRGSLKRQIEEAKAAIIYPPNGLHTVIIGATGVGKTLFAECMFDYGVKTGRFSASAPFIPFNCADYAENSQLLLSQLFGYVKGAFTGASQERAGLIEKADGGMILLDEIHRLPPEGQEMLFYLLDKGLYRRLGETDNLRGVKVLVVAATTEKIDSYLLKTFKRRLPMVIEIPCLKERPLEERLCLIKQFFADEAKKTKMSLKVEAEVIHSLLFYNCAGNVGQLQSDIRLICARGFLEQKSRASQEIDISKNLLPSMIARDFQDINIFEELKSCTLNFGKNFLIFSPEDNQEFITKAIVEKIQNYLNALNEFMSKNYLAKTIDEESSQQELWELTDKLWMTINEEIILENEMIYKIVDKRYMAMISELCLRLERELHFPFNSKIYLLLCLLVNYYNLLTIPQFLEIRNSKILDHDSSSLKVILGELDIKQEVARFLKIILMAFYTGKGSKPRLHSKKKIGLIIIAYGNSTASSILETAHNFWHKQRGLAIDLPLNCPRQEVCNLLEENFKKADEGKGLLVLADTGDLIALSEYVANKLNIKLKIISEIRTITLIVALEHIDNPFLKLEELAKLIKESSPYKSLDSPLEGEKKKIVAVSCVSGYGTAQKIAAWLSSLKALEGKNVQFIPTRGLKQDLRKKEKAIAVVGTVNPNMSSLPFISLEEILSGEGIASLVDIINGKKPANYNYLLENEIYEMAFTALNRFIEFCDPDKMFKVIISIVEGLKNELVINDNLFLRFVIHVGCMIERLLRGQPLKHTRMKSVLKKYDELSSCIEKYFYPLEEFYALQIPQGEYTYLLEMLSEAEKID